MEVKIHDLILKILPIRFLECRCSNLKQTVFYKILPVWFLELNMYDVPIETVFVPVGFLFGPQMCLIL